MPDAAPDDPAAVLLKEFEALQEDLSSLRRKHAELAQAGASQEQRLGTRRGEGAALWTSCRAYCLSLIHI